MHISTGLTLLLCFLVEGADESTAIDGSINATQHIGQPDIAIATQLNYGRLNKNCECINYHCGCCSHLKEEIIHLDDTICANASYLSTDYGFSFTVTFDKFTVYNETLSLRNPPPVCIGAPYLRELASVCVRLYDIQASKAHLHACVEVEARLKHIHIAKYELGCFNMSGKQLETAIRQLENEVL